MRRFNYTGRQRIDQGDIAIRLMSDSSGLRFEARMDARHLTRKYAVPQDARVIVEAYNRTKLERFDYGQIATMPSVRRDRLERFGPEERVYFKVKAVDTNPQRSGLIVAMASRLLPVAPDESTQRSLLPVSVEPLDHVVYKVSFDDPEHGPVLLLNSALEAVTEQGIKRVARAPVFLALVYPQIVREILTRILVIDHFEAEAGDEDEERIDWRHRWIRYAEDLHADRRPRVAGSDNGDVPEELLNWIDRAAGEAARRLESIPRFLQWGAQQP